MCEFGYVLTDDSFKVLNKDDVPMSPGKRSHENRFDLGVYKRDPTFQWAYSYDYYFECSEFPVHYEKIKKLFEIKDLVIFGYSVSNDIHYLDNAFKRYGLEPIEYDVYDIQTMIHYYSKSKEKFASLQDAFKKLCSIDEYIKLQPHLSRDDAYMSMRVLQRICENLNVTPFELILLCNGCKHSSNEYQIKQKKKEDIKIGNNMWEAFGEECSNMAESNHYKGKFLSISGEIKANPQQSQELIKTIREKGFITTRSIDDSNYFLVKDEDDKARIQAVLKHPYTGKIITIQEFLDLDN